MTSDEPSRGNSPILLVAFAICLCLGCYFVYQLFSAGLTLPTTLQAATWLCLSTVFLMAVRRQPEADAQEPVRLHENDTKDQ